LPSTVAPNPGRRNNSRRRFSAACQSTTGEHPKRRSQSGAIVIQAKTLAINPNSEVGVLCHPEPRLVGAKDLRSCLLRSASSDKLQGCFAEFTLSELQRSFASLRMTANGLSMTALRLSAWRGTGVPDVVWEATVQHSVITAISLGFFLRGASMPSDFGASLTTSPTGM